MQPSRVSGITTFAAWLTLYPDAGHRPHCRLFDRHLKSEPRCGRKQKPRFLSRRDRNRVRHRRCAVLGTRFRRCQAWHYERHVAGRSRAAPFCLDGSADAAFPRTAGIIRSRRRRMAARFRADAVRRSVTGISRLLRLHDRAARPRHRDPARIRGRHGRVAVGVDPARALKHHAHRRHGDHSCRSVAVRRGSARNHGHPRRRRRPHVRRRRERYGRRSAWRCGDGRSAGFTPWPLSAFLRF